jgi:ADP-ribose pyrophosphatase YjhB (NUDIX family)
VQVAWRRVAAYAHCRDESDRLLLTRVAPGHPDEGKWTMPGGGMEWGESPTDTARREVLEETGLTIIIGDVMGIFSKWFTEEESYRGEAGHVLGVVYDATQLSGELLTTFDENDSTDAAAWFDIEDVSLLPHVPLVDFVLDLLRARTLG